MEAETAKHQESLGNLADELPADASQDGSIVKNQASNNDPPNNDASSLGETSESQPGLTTCVNEVSDSRLNDNPQAGPSESPGENKEGCISQTTEASAAPGPEVEIVLSKHNGASILTEEISEEALPEIHNPQDVVDTDEDQKKPERFTEPRYEFRDGRLYKKGTNESFDYNVYPDRARNQQHYEKLGNFATRYVYEQLVNAGLSCIVIPRESTLSDPFSFVFASRNFLEDKCDRLLVLIHGSGAVRAGIWARSILINNSVEEGTQLPYIRNALDRGYGVLVLNTNLNYEENLYENEDSDEEFGGNIDDSSEKTETIGGFLKHDCAWSKMRPNGYGRSIPQSNSPDKHAVYVWENLVKNKQSLRSIAIVAHSAGGCVTTRLAQKFPQDFTERVFAICFTDSVHGGLYGIDEKTKKHIIDIGQNWVTSNQPVGAVAGRYYEDDVPHVSAGHTRHEWTSHAAISSIFEFLRAKLIEHTEKSATSSADANDHDRTELIEVESHRAQDDEVKMTEANEQVPVIEGEVAQADNAEMAEEPCVTADTQVMPENEVSFQATASKDVQAEMAESAPTVVSSSVTAHEQMQS